MHSSVLPLVIVNVNERKLDLFNRWDIQSSRPQSELVVTFLLFERMETVGTLSLHASSPSPSPTQQAVSAPCCAPHRRRSSSLGSYDDEQEDLTPAQLTRRIQNLKKKIRKFEDRFEEERKYRVSASLQGSPCVLLSQHADMPACQQLQGVTRG